LDNNFYFFNKDPIFSIKLSIYRETGVVVKNILALLVVSFISFQTYGADFTISVQPSASSVSDAQVSSITLSKISDKGALASKNSVDYNSSDILNKPVLGSLAARSSLLAADIPDLSTTYALNSSLSSYVSSSSLTSSLSLYTKTSLLGSLASKNSVDYSSTDVSNKPTLGLLSSKDNLSASDVPSITSAKVSDFTAAVQAINAVSGTSEVIGAIKMYAGASAPTGYLFCKGQAVSRSTYSALFAVIGIAYGSGDGSTTFNLPDTQGIFVRGAGSQNIAGIDYSGTLAAKQNDQFQSHIHSPNLFKDYSFTNGSSATVKTGDSGAGNTSLMKTLGPESDAVDNPTRTGKETRPANISLNYIIKY
jgi:microcystin-dependent protein